MPHLIFLDEQFGGRSYELICERTTVGRGSENTLTIRDGSLSRAHCEILTFGSEVIVRDLGSRNGTFIDGRRLNHTQAQAKHGQIISFGNVQVRLDIDYVDEESDEDTAFYDFMKYREPENARGSMEAIHLALPDKGSFIEETIQLRAVPSSVAEPISMSPAETSRATRPQLFWIAIWVILLFGLALSVLR
jgi:predicted component of type VI protein secretion system